MDGMTLAQKARQLGPAILEFWDRTWRDEAAPLPIRVACSEKIMERGYGKAVSVIDMAVTAERPVSSLSTEELIAIAMAPLGNPQLIDVSEVVELPDPEAVFEAVSGEE